MEQLTEYRKPIDINLTERTKEIDLKTKIQEAAYYLALKQHYYNDLCWILAEKIQKRNLITPTTEDIRKMAEEISNLSKTYDELCWLNAEMELKPNTLIITKH
ncbi:MAG: hypothetical protein ACFFBY_07220 [Promethearchaeota archaeon]